MYVSMDTNVQQDQIQLDKKPVLQVIIKMLKSSGIVRNVMQAISAKELLSLHLNVHMVIIVQNNLQIPHSAQLEHLVTHKNLLKKQSVQNVSKDIIVIRQVSNSQMAYVIQVIIVMREL